MIQYEWTLKPYANLRWIFEITALCLEIFPGSYKKIYTYGIDQSFYAIMYLDVVVLLILIPCAKVHLPNHDCQVMKQLTH